MKPHSSNQKNRALTIWEVLVVIAVIAILAFIILPPGSHPRPPRIQCVSNLKQINLAFRIWEGDNANKYPMAISVTNGGAMESIATGDVVTCFLVMSNELSTPKLLICPSDAAHTYATNFGDSFNRSNISYFVGVDADEAHPERIMSGDDNFAVDGVPLKSGLSEVATNADIV
jgi:hypothetical protein